MALSDRTAEWNCNAENATVSRFIILNVHKRNMVFAESEAVMARFDQLSGEYGEALKMISSGCSASMSDQLRQSLERVAGEVQGAIEDGAVLTMNDLVMLCAAETKSIFKSKISGARNDYAHMLYRLSKNMLA